MNINDYIKSRPDNAILLDVRTSEEYADRHIPESINIPLNVIENIKNSVRNRNTPIYVYCRSGTRSAGAVSTLKRMGYTNVTNIGGIIDWNEEV